MQIARNLQETQIIRSMLVSEIVAGIKEYFNVMLGTELLYKFGRPQCAEILTDHPDGPVFQVYLVWSTTSTGIICMNWSDVGLYTSG